MGGGTGFSFVFIINRNCAFSSPMNAVRRFCVLDVIERFWLAIDKLPFCARLIPHSPQSVLYEHICSSGEVRFVWPSVEQWTFGELFIGTAVISADRQPDLVVVLDGRSDGPSGLVHVFQALMIDNAQRHYSPLVKGDKHAKAQQALIPFV